MTARSLGGEIDDFTRSGFVELLTEYRNNGYSFVDFSDDMTTHGQVILRHDIDLDLDAAVQAAQIEHELDIRATYFILMSASHYNPFSARGRRALQELVDLGHAIGLHVDPSFDLHSDSRIEIQMRDEAHALASLIGQEVRTISWHKPATYRPPTTNMGFRDAYSPSFTEFIHYSSDSSGWWKFGDFRHSESFRNKESVQLLLHPIWWMHDTAQHPIEIVSNFLVRATDGLEKATQETVTPWRNFVNGEPGSGAWTITNENLRGLRLRPGLESRS